jgi:hypothetical protein
MTADAHAAVRIESLVLHARQPQVLAEFWRDLLGYVVAPNYTDSVQLRHPTDQGPPLLIAGSEAPAVSSSLHLDLRPEDQAGAVALALSLGARLVEGGTEVSWVVLSDPEGNKFCILQSSSDYDAWRWTTDKPYRDSL